MKDEIKEILDFLKDKRGYYKTLSQDKTDKLLDYITNLQDENENYKQRINKAIKYIWSTKYEWGDLDQDNEDFDIDVYELLNILNGGDEE